MKSNEPIEVICPFCGEEKFTRGRKYFTCCGRRIEIKENRIMEEKEVILTESTFHRRNTAYGSLDKEDLED